MSVVLMKH